MLAEELAVVVLVRVLFRAHEEHVLAKVRQPGQLPGVGEVAHVDVQGRRGLVRLGVGNDEGTQAILQ